MIARLHEAHDHGVGRPRESLHGRTSHSATADGPDPATPYLINHSAPLTPPR
ncbi:hypothetical protein BDU57DRAFT_512496 [Ampelomyces quisqualis]|uniref:Uncharacterized protein n=1 Tax=Ampelomyces quisqualis TaxID=50730 RepID=A0A6A5QVN2_AMPQU|nr:hypothetical protein BDU57DRAFT_512496 [Ampelomyces quisqualis]